MTTEERFTRIETILERVVENQDHFDGALTTVLESQIKIAESHSKLADAQTKLTDTQAKLAEAQAKTDTQIKALGLAMEALERQWQAYINTIRPQ